MDKNLVREKRAKKKIYKGVKSNVKTNPPKEKRTIKVLESNEDRYESEEEENKISSATDFAILANVPINQGSRFQFKSEKDSIFNIEESSQNLSIFNLDLIMLEKSLSTLPFYQRCGIPKDQFTGNEPKVMDSLEEKEKEYVEYLKSKQIVEVENLFISSDSETSDVEETLELPANSPSKEQPEDLEEWLDNILDC